MIRNWLKNIMLEIVKEDKEVQQGKATGVERHEFIAGCKEINRIYQIENGYLVHLQRPDSDFHDPASVVQGTGMMYCKNATAVGRHIVTMQAKRRLGIKSGNPQGELKLASKSVLAPTSAQGGTSR